MESIQHVGSRLGTVSASHPRRGSSDQPVHRDRRNGLDRRHYRDTEKAGSVRFPSKAEQGIQFATRYLCFALGVAFFNFFGGITPAWSLAYVNAAYAVYFAVNTLFLVHALRHPVSPTRCRLAMWTDIVIISISVLNDPYHIPPSLLVYIMVVLGNGMRYGLRLFGEALIGCLGAGTLALSLRFIGTTSTLPPGVLFLGLLGGIILVYAYVLMGRIEASRRNLRQEQEKVSRLSGELMARIQQRFAQWNLSKSEQEVGLLLIRGFSMKEIAEIRGVTERTTRHQATSLYTKSGLANRTEFASHFIEDLMSEAFQDDLPKIAPR